MVEIVKGDKTKYIVWSVIILVIIFIVWNICKQSKFEFFDSENEENINIQTLVQLYRSLEFMWYHKVNVLKNNINSYSNLESVDKDEIAMWIDQVYENYKKYLQSKKNIINNVNSVSDEEKFEIYQLIMKINDYITEFNNISYPFSHQQIPLLNL